MATYGTQDEGAIKNVQFIDNGTIGQKTQNEDKQNTKTQNNMCWTPLYTKKHNKVNKTGALLQTAGGKDKPNIVLMRKS